MLRLVDIHKDYLTGDSTVHALKKITINFRANEFVSVFGPSGSGKTTLLNLIGGLDRYTAGNLIINGVATEKFDAHAWDVYRNHRIGFVFQSYNLIPHQTILENVELALTISGIDKTERIERAKDVLNRVGLSDQYDKKPNQLSGGQQQRVAIARALINEPEILLLDEPTGSLDTKTSIQIMDLIKKISHDRLVIMVTHNAELASKYSTRIVELLDGELISDTNPCGDEEEESETVRVIKKEKEEAKMNLWTAFRLSARNLMSKFKRTLLVGLAGSIGIIGIAAVLAVRNGISGYIDNMQEDMLSGNPIKIDQTVYDLDALANNISRPQQAEIVSKAGIVGIRSIIGELGRQSDKLNKMMVSNEITPEYIEYLKEMPETYRRAIKYEYGIKFANNIYTEFTDGGEGSSPQMLSVAAAGEICKKLLEETEVDRLVKEADYVMGLVNPFAQSVSDPEYIECQYELLDGKIASEKEEIMIVVNKNTELTDLLLMRLGYYTRDEFVNLVYKHFKKESYDEEKNYRENVTYEELKSKKLVLYPNDSVYEKNEGEDKENHPFRYHPNAKGMTGGLELKIVGILRPKNDIEYGTLKSGFYFTEALAEYFMAQNKTSEIVEYMNDKKLKEIKFKNLPVYDLNYRNVSGLLKQEKGVTVSGVRDMISSFMGTPAPLTINNLGGCDIPNSVSVYPADFAQKDNIRVYLDKWNSSEDIIVGGKTYTSDDRKDIKYTDMLSLVISMIDTMIDAVTTALIIFTAISLVVSTVMIGIITYVSVVERTKEIGVIRSLGGSKRDVGHLFNAETFIIGSVAGLLGIGITYLFSLIANVVIEKLTEIPNLTALKFTDALLMLFISIALTSLSGLIPSRAAAAMDPVNALRSE